MSDASGYRESSLQSWEAAAPAWERERGTLQAATAELTSWLIERAGARPGATMLELAAGPGETGLRAAARVQPGGSVLLTDQAPSMVEAARRHAEQLGLDNVEFRVMDAERLDLPDGSIDGVICRFGLMLMADPGACLREVARVLRPDGKLAAAVWGDPAENPWPGVLGQSLVELGLTDPPAPGPGMFALADEEQLRAVVTGSRLAPPEVVRFPVRFTYADASEYWRIHSSLSTVAARAIAAAPPDTVTALREAVQRRLEPYRTEAGFELPGLALGLSTGPAR